MGYLIYYMHCILLYGSGELTTRPVLCELQFASLPLYKSKQALQLMDIAEQHFAIHTSREDLLVKLDKLSLQNP